MQSKLRIVVFGEWSQDETRTFILEVASCVFVLPLQFITYVHILYMLVSIIQSLLEAPPPEQPGVPLKTKLI